MGAEAAAGFAQLPDCRGYELVTPVDKNGALPEYLFQGGPSPSVAEDGDRVIVGSLQCFSGSSESCASNHDKSEGQPFAFVRMSGGWVTQPLAPPSASLETDDAWITNANVGNALFSGPVAPESAVEAFYAREPGGALVEVGQLGETALGEGAEASELDNSAIVATADLSHVLYETHRSMWSFDTAVENGHLYEYTQECGGGAGCGVAKPALVGVSGGAGSASLVSRCGTGMPNSELGAARGELLSQDGEIVYFRSEACEGGTGGNVGIEVPVGELFARIGVGGTGARAAAISEPQAEGEGLEPPVLGSRGECDETTCEENTSLAVEQAARGKSEEGPWRSAAAVGASADGSRVFFLSEQQLTNSASEGKGNNLYESECVGCEGLSAKEERARRRWIDLDDPGAGATAVPGGPQVQGVVASSADGSHVYFVAKAKLASNTSVLGKEAVEGEENLYVYANGMVAFIGALSEADAPDWEFVNGNVTPEGAFLVFESQRALTADDTRLEDLAPGQVYEYDADTGALVRVSIGNEGFNDDGNDGVLGEKNGSPSDDYEGNAEISKPHDDLLATVPVRRDPTMSNNGEFVFFQSPVALTPGALNDVPAGVERFAENIYEYHDGHVYLLSDGKDTTGENDVGESPVKLLGSDETGRNVFFWTFDPLVEEDGDTQRDLYDAHVCSEAEPCVIPSREATACVEGDCQESVSSPGVLGAPAGSATFIGPGNPVSAPAPVVKPVVLTRAQKLARALKSCRGMRVKRRRVACEATARKRYGPVRKERRAAGRGGRAGGR